MTQHVLAVLSSQEDRDHIAKSSYAGVVQFCETDDALSQTISKRLSYNGGGLSGIIVELDRHRSLAGFGATRTMDDVGTRCVPIAIRTHLTSDTLRRVADIATYRSAYWISVVTAEPADVAVRDLVCASGRRAAQLAVLDKLTRELPLAVRGIVEVAVLLTHRRTSVRTLAAACNMAVRTVEWRLASVGAPPAGTILGWSRALHTVWQLDVLGWTHKRVAREAGFGSAELCDMSIERHTGARPLQICRAGGFDVLLDRVALRLQAPNSTGLGQLLFPERGARISAALHPKYKSPGHSRTVYPSSGA